MDLISSGQRVDPDLKRAGSFQGIYARECFAHGLTQRQTSMISENEHALVAQVSDHALALIGVQDYATIVMIGDVLINGCGKLIRRLKTLGQRSHGDTIQGMQMNHAVCVFSGLMKC